MLKKLLISISFILISVTAFYFINKNRSEPQVGDKLLLTTSFYPYYFFASSIVRDKANVISLTPPGVEPHDYELSPGDIVKIQSSKLLIINGRIEPWSEKIKSDLKDGPVKIVEADQSLFTEKAINETGELEADPHIWLSPVLAKNQVDAIYNAIIQIDPENAKYYLNNTKTLRAQLEDLDNDFRKGLAECKDNNIVTSHSAFEYLANEYGLSQISISGLSPEAEPSLKELAEIADFAKKNDVKYIFFETLISPKLANTIASEIGAKTLVLNPLEGLVPTEIANGENYISVMKNNLENLKIALQCQ